MALELYLSGKSFLELSQDLGIEVGMLQRWNSEYVSFWGSSFSGNEKKILRDEQNEILFLKKQLKNADIERDILKKAVSIFSRSDCKSIGSSRTLKINLLLIGCVKCLS
jgi:transposase